jgi:cold-inducible RNA-binding protein
VNIYIGNLSSDTTEGQLRKVFAGYGQVLTVKLITDRDSGQPRGFAFVEMSARREAVAAISGLNGKKLNGRALSVNEARGRAQSGNRSGGNHYRKLY